MTEKDPDIIVLRWSTLKRVLTHWFWWTLILYFVGWLGDITIYSDNTTLENAIFLLIISGVMTAMSCQKN